MRTILNETLLSSARARVGPCPRRRGDCISSDILRVGDRAVRCSPCIVAGLRVLSCLGQRHGLHAFRGRSQQEVPIGGRQHDAIARVALDTRRKLSRAA